jgi:uncharacterized protein (DUF2249 family)
MTTSEFLDLDVRPILAGGQDPFAEIMAAVGALAPGQALRIVAPFRPAPLFKVLASRGFSHQASPLPGGAWEVVFRQTGPVPEGVMPIESCSCHASEPAPASSLDTRGLEPPEPMTRILATLETMNDGEVLTVDLDREPLFLLPELAKRGHAWNGAASGDGYQLLVRVGAGKEKA